MRFRINAILRIVDQAGVTSETIRNNDFDRSPAGNSQERY